ncbi:MAG TPA: hypothetical protein RMH99_26060, partial [Sandaracinaceae bacterium LLY-WYZ-13_1]|nr:hypothetical protein [Sandaracinaceae bacterium LLY-WYZ-13_1]
EDPTTVATEVGELLNRAGYVAVALAHPGRERSPLEALCRAIGVPMADCRAEACARGDTCRRDGPDGPEPGTCVVDPPSEDGFCSYFKHLNYDRPNDLAAVLDWIEAQSAPGGRLEGRVDLERVVYAGHSAGGGAAMMVAGATREYGGTETLLGDPRPIAFVSASPQGPGDEDFTERSFTGAGCRDLAPDASRCLTRPHLVLTGEGDVTQEHLPADRRRSFELLPEGDKHMGYLLDADARHGFYSFSVDACDAAPARCEAMHGWLVSAFLAFLDAYVRDSERARAYLASDALDVLSGGDLEVSRR